MDGRFSSCYSTGLAAGTGFGHVGEIDGQDEKAYNRHTIGKQPGMALSRVDMGNPGLNLPRLRSVVSFSITRRLAFASQSTSSTTSLACVAL